MKKNRKPEKDYYAQLNRWVSQYEKPGVREVSSDTITNKICWCWKFRKITKEQMEELCNRMTEVFYDEVKLSRHINRGE